MAPRSATPKADLLEELKTWMDTKARACAFIIHDGIIVLADENMEEPVYKIVASNIETRGGLITQRKPLKIVDDLTRGDWR
jgi:hypothetical protein